MQSYLEITEKNGRVWSWSPNNHTCYRRNFRFKHRDRATTGNIETRWTCNGIINLIALRWHFNCVQFPRFLSRNVLFSTGDDLLGRPTSQVQRACAVLPPLRTWDDNKHPERLPGSYERGFLRLIESPQLPGIWTQSIRLRDRCSLSPTVPLN